MTSGTGHWQTSEPGAETYNAVLSALKLGYRHIDTAQYYENEADVGRAVKDSGIPREEIFALETTRASNEKLGLGYIDLYLLHAPGDAATREETWRALKELHEQGVLKDIGVSNFGEAHLEKLLKTAKVKPAVNQVELHPWLMRPTLVKYCKEHDILLEAYSPLAKAIKLTNPTLLEIATEVDATPAQVLVAFSLANDFITLPKSVNPERQKANLEAANVKLTPAQIAKLVALDEYLVTGWDPIKDHADEGLYLLHAPGDVATRDESWRALEELHGQGILKDIEVSNFGEAHLEKLLKTAKVKPAVNQVELHPWLMRPTLVKYCQEQDILLEAYSPLARAQKMDNPTLVVIAKEVGATPAQVLVAFSLANGFITLPKSVHEERQKSNLEAATIKLTDAQIAKLAALDEYLVTCWDPIKDHAV
ncbi:hypothetical protein PInf_026519 [Phytophthora infestans]|nr:hypothetical protein PInf_026519 [Phytophthora infestans]